MTVPAIENTFVGLKQTVCFDLKGSARAVGKISVQEWLSFLKVDAGIDMTTVEQALQHTITGGLFVTMNTEEQYKVVLGKAEAGVAWSKQGGAMVYGWSAGEEVTSLHLNNVFSNSDMEAIRFELSKCGKIVAEHRQYYKDCPTVKTGVVTVKMRLSPQAVVPTYLLEQRVGNTVQVFSDRHRKLCHRCLEHGHLTAFCREPVKSRQAASKSKTWAMVASASGSASHDISVSDTTVSVPSPMVTKEKDPQPMLQDTVQSVPVIPAVAIAGVAMAAPVVVTTTVVDGSVEVPAPVATASTVSTEVSTRTIVDTSADDNMQVDKGKKPVEVSTVTPVAGEKTKEELIREDPDEIEDLRSQFKKFIYSDDYKDCKDLRIRWERMSLEEQNEIVIRWSVDESDIAEALAQPAPSVEQVAISGVTGKNIDNKSKKKKRVGRSMSPNSKKIQEEKRLRIIQGLK